MTTPPEANPEYSRGDRGSRGGQPRSRSGSGGARGARGDRGRTTRLDGFLILAALGSCALLIAAEPLTLYAVRVAGRPAATRVLSSGDHHGYALVPIALLGAALSAGILGRRGRAATIATGVLALSALLIILVADLPDARVTGLAGSAALGYFEATSRPGAGLYVETSGAVGLLLAAGLRLFLLTPWRTPAPHNPGLDADSESKHPATAVIRS
jgi:hypothetical protein